MEQAVTIEEPIVSIYVFTALVFALFMVLESVLGRRALEANLLWRWSNNFSLGMLSWYISTVVGTWALIWVLQFDPLEPYKLTDYFLPRPVQGFFILLLISQFVTYWYHRAFHAFPWLWSIHAVHHADTDVDVSTAYRHHPLEPLVSLPVMVPIVVILGVSADSALAYRLFAVFATVLSHSNVRVPESLERWLRWFLLTPDFHRLHHCAERRFTNSNYGSLVPWFDYVFGTARVRPYDEQASMTLGLEYLREPRDSRLDQQLITPVRLLVSNENNGEPGAVE